METVQGTRDDITILLELMMYQGRDINLVTMYDMFKTINLKAGLDEGFSKAEEFEDEITKNFNTAIA